MAIFNVSLMISAQGLLKTLYYDGIYYQQTDELRVTVIPTHGEKYAGSVSIPNFFNVTTYDAEGKAIISSYFVTAVADGAFEGCDELRSITFNGATVKFGKNAFKGCTSLRSFNFPSSFAADTEMGESAFEGCTSLSEIVFANRVADIPARAFAGCTDLAEVTIASTTVPAVAADAFEGSSVAKATLNVPKSSLSEYKAAQGWKEFKTINAIAEYSFIADGIYYQIDELNPKKVKVTLDGYGSYSGEVNIPEFVLNNGTTYTVSEIGRDAFRGCTELTGVTIPESILGVGVNAFQGCSKLESITLPSTIGTLPDGLFRDCVSLKSFTCPAELAAIRQNVFYGCSSLESIELSPEVYIIGAYAFADCVSLKKFEASEKMYMIGDYAFKGCSGLEEVVGTPQWEYWYAKGTFGGCNNIKIVDIKAANPPRCPNSNMFDEVVYETAVLIVPAGTEEAYRTSVHGDNNTPDIWQLFKHIQSSEAGVEEIEADLDCEPVYYNLRGIKESKPAKGNLYIRLQGKKTDKIIF